MNIGIGRKQLVVSLRDVPPECRRSSIDIPYAIEANDNELARLSTTRTFASDRANWETNALLYGAFRLRES